MERINEPLCAVCGSPIALRELRTEQAGSSIHIRCWSVDAAPAARNGARARARSRGVGAAGGYVT